jgi:hypothetical protein
LAAVDLVCAHHGLNRTAEPSLYRYKPPVVAALQDLRFRRIHVDPYVRKPPSGRPVSVPPEARVLATNAALEDALFPPVGARWDLEGSYEWDSLGLYPAPLRSLVERFWAVEGHPAYLQLLQMGAVSRVVAFETSVEALRPLQAFPTLYPEPVQVFEVPDPLPRCYAVSSSRIADGGAALALVTDPSFDPKTEAIVSSGSPRPPIPGFSGSCSIETLVPDRVVLQGTLSHPGILVLVDTYDPGWRVRVDGLPAPLLRANVTFRGVALPEGSHRVELLYRPFSVQIGALVSIATLLIAIGGALRLR